MDFVRVVPATSKTMQAIRITNENMKAVAFWCFGHVNQEDDSPYVWSTELSAVVGDWVIRDTEGEFSSCSDSKYRELYVETKKRSEKHHDEDHREH